MDSNQKKPNREPLPETWTSAADSQRVLEIWELLASIKKMMPPPKPISRFDEPLYRISLDLGFQPIPDTQFRLDFKNNFLCIKSDEPASVRLLSVGHELGHARRLRRGVFDTEATLRWNRGGDNWKDAALIRYILKEEVMAWREGMSILRSVGCAFSSPAGVRAFRQACLATYRVATSGFGGAVRALRVKE